MLALVSARTARPGTDLSSVPRDVELVDRLGERGGHGAGVGETVENDRVGKPSREKVRELQAGSHLLGEIPQVVEVGLPVERDRSGFTIHTIRPE